MMVRGFLDVRIIIVVVSGSILSKPCERVRSLSEARSCSGVSAVSWKSGVESKEGHVNETSKALPYTSTSFIASNTVKLGGDIYCLGKF